MNTIEENTVWMQDTAGSWLEQFNSPTLATGILKWLIKQHCEEHRGYHTLQHLRLMYEELTPHLSDCAQPEAMLAALWWHDSIYDPKKGDNEVNSASFAVKHLTALGASPEFIKTTEALILATASHTTAKSTPEQNLFLDADLSILGQPDERYTWYAEGVNKEFNYVPQILYRKGRKKLLGTFLQSDMIFRTQHFHSTYEEKARENISNEIKML